MPARQAAAVDSLDLNHQINRFDFSTLLNSTENVDFKWSLDAVTRDVFQRTIDQQAVPPRLPLLLGNKTPTRLLLIDLDFTCHSPSLRGNNGDNPL